MRIIETKVYKYAELSDAAKIARLEWREVDVAEFIGDAPLPEVCE